MKNGYVYWNRDVVRQLVMTYDFSSQPDSDTVLAGTLPFGYAEFDHWLGLINYICDRKLAPQESKSALTIRFFQGLAHIQYPMDRYVGIKGRVEDVPLSSIVRIEEDAAMPLRVDTTGMDVLSEADIRLLSEVRPRFTVEVEGSVSASVYAVYGERVTLTEVLEHALSPFGGDVGDILVNRVRIRGGHSGAGPSVPVDKAPEIMEFKHEIEAFLSKMRESDFVACQSEQAALRQMVEGMPRDDPGRKSFVDRQQELRVRCGDQPSRERVKWRSLGDDDKLRRLGVLKFSYAWD